MIPALLGLVLAPYALQDEVLAPLPPIGTTSAYQQGIKDVSALLEAGEFAEATKRAKNLPSHAIRVGLAFEGVDGATQRLFNQAVETSFAAWKKAIPELQLSVAANPQIKISVVNELPTGDEEEKSLVLFPSPDPADPSLEAVLALKRLATKVGIDQSYMAAEVSYIIGQYLGAERVPVSGSVMFRMEGFGPRTSVVDMAISRLAKETLSQSDQLRDYAKKKTRIVAAFPEGFLPTKDIDFGTIAQGENQQFQIEVLNRGKAPLTFTIKPDCSCFALDYKPVIEPGETSVVSIYMSTKDFQGHQDKGLFIYTNDAENSVTRVSVHGMIRPAYRLKTLEQADNTFIMTDSGLQLSYYLFADEKLPFEPRKVSINGTSGVASISEWEGEITDPEWFEGKQHRKGYKIDLLLSPSTVIGRNLVALLVQTDSETFPVVAANFYVQKGVAVSPKTIFFGDVDPGGSQASTILTGPSDDFVIESVESKDERFKPKIEKISGNNYRLTVDLNPGETRGTIVGSIIVKTNNADSPLITIPVQAYVR